MTPTELQKILKSDEKLSVEQVKEIMRELMKETIGKGLDLQKYKCIQMSNNISDLAIQIQPLFEEKFYEGQIKSFGICLDLLAKVGDDNGQK